MLQAIFLILIVGAGTAGELCVTRAMKELGEVKDFRPRALLRVIGRALREKWMWAGLGLMTLAFFSLLGMLSLANVSFVVPVTALSYAAGTLGGELFLGEQVTAKRWAGVAIVCVGVTLVFLGRG